MKNDHWLTQKLMYWERLQKLSKRRLVLQELFQKIMGEGISTKETSHASHLQPYMPYMPYQVDISPWFSESWPNSKTKISAFEGTF